MVVVAAAGATDKGLGEWMSMRYLIIWKFGVEAVCCPLGDELLVLLVLLSRKLKEDSRVRTSYPLVRLLKEASFMPESMNKFQGKTSFVVRKLCWRSNLKVWTGMMDLQHAPDHVPFIVTGAFTGTCQMSTPRTCTQGTCSRLSVRSQFLLHDGQ